MCLDGAGLYIPFDPVVKDGSLETHTGKRSVWNADRAGKSQRLGCEGWGCMSNYLAGKEREELAN